MDEQLLFAEVGFFINVHGRRLRIPVAVFKPYRFPVINREFISLVFVG